MIRGDTLALLNDVCKALRTNNQDEVSDLIEAAKADLKLSGVHQGKIIDDDPLIKRAIIVYCKANYGYDEQGDRFQKSYDMLKMHLTLSKEYTESDDG